ncbi:DUF4124 domain-containing protein [Catenovulum sp. SM1970]|uniref:DUF4124 domain-containing protein n=1 Tax=Marinifaba aquimaris TaxID=2741323 RepID=UPI0015743176|nr:DUF4124 domain-containing protein [Marinifaba aquimaris]NTS76334.1 DUF4124 domain-containing protein [Marinifaba aquimaris]
MKLKLTYSALIALLSVIAMPNMAVASTDGVYQWVDDKGVVHFSAYPKDRNSRPVALNKVSPATSTTSFYNLETDKQQNDDCEKRYRALRIIENLNTNASRHINSLQAKRERLEAECQ